MKFEDVKVAFHDDGSLRDIYVFDCDKAVWYKFLSLVRKYKYRFTIGGEYRPLPSNLGHFWAVEKSISLLTIDLGSISLNCIFYVADEIELIANPREFTGQQPLDELIDFMGKLSGSLSRDVFLTEENSKDQIWFRTSADTGKVTFVR